MAEWRSWRKPVSQTDQRPVPLIDLDFNTTNYFTRYVKRVLGMTPSQYKAKFSVKK